MRNKELHEEYTKEELQQLKEELPKHDFIGAMGHEDCCLTENVWDGVLADVDVEKGLLQVSYNTEPSGEGTHLQTWFPQKHIVVLVDADKDD